jgi:hypothetical protein
MYNDTKGHGKKARNLRELRNALETVGKTSVFHHTYQYFLKGHILEYTNDFAQWAGKDWRVGAAFRIGQLLNNPDMAKGMGERRREYVRNNFLIMS